MRDRLLNWLNEILKRNWVTLFLVACLVSILIFSLQDANWVSDVDPLIGSFLWGLGFGWLLARSRFPGWFAALYAVAISSFVTLQGVGHIIPALGDVLRSPWGSLVDGMNLRATTLYLRATGWADTLQRGKNIQDSGLFVLLLGIVLALCAVWLLWAIMRQRRALNGLLPLGLLLAINVHLSREPLSYYMVFLFCALLLVAREAFNGQHEDWQRRQIDYPESLGVDWAISASALVVVIVMVSRLAPLFGTAEGWQILSEWARSTQQTTNNTATRLFSGVNPPPPQPGQKLDVYANPPDVGQVGVPITQGDETIMWVKISDAPPLPPAIAEHVSAPDVPIHYWRSGIYSAYTGRGWKPAPVNTEISSLAVLAQEPPRGRYYLTQNFELQVKTSGTLFAVNDPLRAGPAAALHATLLGDSHLLTGQGQKYQVISEANQVTAQQLILASQDYPAEIRQTYLQLPGSLPDRVISLAKRVTAGTTDPYHKALAIQTYLRNNYPYNLQVPPPPANRDVVDYFLFDAPGGFCSYYASAMAVMLRTVNVPARVVTGYAMGNFDTQKQAYRVPASAAHAWVEVYFPGYGWIEFEPTAARTAIIYAEGAVQKPGTLPSTAAQKGAPVETGQPFWAWLLVAGAALLLALPVLLLRMFTSTARAPLLQADVLYRRMRRVLAWAGFDALPSLTPDEYLALYAGQLQPYGQLSQALQQVTSLYRETVYSAHAPDVQRVRSANRLWQNSIRDFMALWLKKFWERLYSQIA